MSHLNTYEITEEEQKQIRDILEKNVDIIKFNLNNGDFYFIATNLNYLASRINKIYSLSNKRSLLPILLENMVGKDRVYLPIINIEIPEQYRTYIGNGINNFKHLGNIIEPNQDYKEKIDLFAEKFHSTEMKIGLLTYNLIEHIMNNINR